MIHRGQIVIEKYLTQVALLLVIHSNNLKLTLMNEIKKKSVNFGPTYYPGQEWG
jgi:hypothetical protein